MKIMLLLVLAARSRRRTRGLLLLLVPLAHAALTLLVWCWPLLRRWLQATTTRR